MLNFPYFSHDLIKKYTIAFGALFSNVHVARKSRDGQEFSFFRVPLTWVSKDKMLLRLEQDPNIQKPSAIDLPIMSFEYNIVGYDKDRSINRNLTIVGPPVGDSDMATTLTPVPYDLAFQLYAYVKFEEDGQKIASQILPFFHPDMTLNLELIPELNLTRDIPLILQGVSKEERNEGQLIDRPVNIWTFTFVMKAFFFGPVVNRPLIKFVDVKVYPVPREDVDGHPPGLTVLVYPGLDANGHATSNAEIAINALDVNINDDWGIVTVFNSPIDTQKEAELAATLDAATLTANGTVV